MAIVVVRGEIIQLLGITAALAISAIALTGNLDFHNPFFLDGPTAPKDEFKALDEIAPPPTTRPFLRNPDLTFEQGNWSSAPTDSYSWAPPHKNPPITGASHFTAINEGIIETRRTVVDLLRHEKEDLQRKLRTIEEQIMETELQHSNTQEQLAAYQKDGNKDYKELIMLESSLTRIETKLCAQGSKRDHILQDLNAISMVHREAKKQLQKVVSEAATKFKNSPTAKKQTQNTFQGKDAEIGKKNSERPETNYAKPAQRRMIEWSHGIVISICVPSILMVAVIAVLYLLVDREAFARPAFICGVLLFVFVLLSVVARYGLIYCTRELVFFGGIFMIFITCLVWRLA